MDELDKEFDFVVSAVSYWEPAAAKIHAMRKSVPGGMGHGCELETAFQLATRPELVKMAELAGAKYGPVGWDLVAPSNPTRTYMRRPRPAAGHAAIFGDPDQSHRRSRQRLHRCGGRRAGGDIQEPAGLLSGAALSGRLFASVDRIRPPAEIHRCQMRGVQEVFEQFVAPALVLQQRLAADEAKRRHYATG